MKSLVFFIAVIVGTCSAYAANIRDLDVGDGMYLQGIFSDELVYVVRFDYEHNRVKIRRSEDGTTKWVSASDLISREASTENNIMRGAAAAGLIVCAFNPEACENNSNSSSSQNSSQGNSSSDSFNFKITNNCKHKAKLALHYRKLDGNWSTNGWWEINGNSWRYLTFKDGSYVKTNNSIFYYYAEAADGSFYWSGGNKNYTLNGKNLAMKKIEDKSGDSELTLSCDGR